MNQEKLEKNREFIISLVNHPAYQGNALVRAIVDEYRGMLLDASLSEREEYLAMQSIKGALEDFSKNPNITVEAYLRGLRLREQYLLQKEIARESGLFDGVDDTGQMDGCFSDGEPVIVRDGKYYVSRLGVVSGC